MSRFLVVAVLVAACGSSNGDAGDDVREEIDPGRSSVTVDRPHGVVADGGDVAIVTITLADANGAPLVGRDVTLGGPNDVMLGVLQPTDAQGTTSGTVTSTVAGVKLISATAEGISLADSVSIEFVPGPAAKLVFVTPPTSGQAGSYLPPIQVALTDAFDNHVTADGPPIKLELAANNVGASLFGDVFEDAVAGVATFDEVGVAIAGTALVARASAPSIGPVESAPFDVVAGPQTVCTPMLPGAPNIYLAEAARTMIGDDFNGDGHRDLAILELNGLVILRGLGTGKFLDPVRYPLSSARGALTSGDFDGDGDADIALPAWGENHIKVFLNQGNGTFVAGPSVPTAVEASSLVAGDFDTNGTLDLAARSDHTVSIYAGAGDGSFQLATTVPLAVPMYSTSWTSIAWGHINGDATKDLFTVDSLGYYTVLLGSTNGTFQALTPVAIQVWNGGAGVALTEVDGDNKPDVFVGTRVLRGNGDGTFQAAMSVGSPFRDVWAVDAADVNNDGNQDLIAATSGYSLFAVEVFAGNGDGTFMPAKQVAVNKLARSVAAADFNGDGKLDVATNSDFGSSASSTVTVFAGLGDGTLVGTEFHGNGIGPTRASFWEVAGDFDGNGTLDLVAENHVTKQTGIQLRAASGALTAMPTLPIASAYSGVAKDFDNDGKLDLLALGPPGVRWLRGNGDGTLQAPIDSTVSGWSLALRVVRLDLDTVDDIVVVNPLDNKVTVAFGAGNGTWINPAQYTVGAYPEDVQVADLDADGDNDLVVANRQGASISVLLNAGAGTFAAATSYSMFGSPKSLTIADLDGDDDLDVLAGNEGQKTVGFYKGRGDGTFDAELKINVGTPTYWVRLFDIDSDGQLDLLAQYDGLLVFQGLGNLMFGPGRHYGISAARRPVMGDFNADGKIDFMTPQSAWNEPGFMLLYNRGCQ